MPLERSDEITGSTITAVDYADPGYSETGIQFCSAKQDAAVLALHSREAVTSKPEG